MKTTEERLSDLEERVVQLEAAVCMLLAPVPYSLEDQHRIKAATRALGKTKEG